MLLAIALIPVGWLASHAMTWGPAERTENMLSDLYRDAADLADNDGVSKREIEKCLAKPKFEFLKSNLDESIEPIESELAWFSPNRKYSIAVCKDGSKTWMVNGIRR